MASEQETLLSYFRLFMKNFEKRVGINRTESCLNGYRNSYDHLVRFLQSQYKLSDIPFAALDRSFIEKFDLHLRTECHLAPGTIVNLTVRLKTIVGEAIADGIITVFPFVGYEPIHPQPEQKYLTTEELNRIMTTPLHSRTLYHVRDLFLFSCYTGIPYSDMCMLTNENLSLAEDGTWWIRSSRKKTGVDFEIPLMELPLHIIEKYRDVAPEGKLLPMYSNSSLNHYLKQIAVLCGIERKLVFHTARHTYATEITLSHGVPLETVSKMLGHSRIGTTQLYAKVTDHRLMPKNRQTVDGHHLPMKSCHRTGKVLCRITANAESRKRTPRKAAQQPFLLPFVRLCSPTVLLTGRTARTMPTIPGIIDSGDAMPDGNHTESHNEPKTARLTVQTIPIQARKIDGTQRADFSGTPLSWRE